MKRSEKKDYLVSVAHALFNEHGYHAVGIDKIIAKAGVAKTTLYRHFKSKDDLIVAVLRKADAQTRNAMRQYVDADERQESLLATFDYLLQWFRGDNFYGCPFMGAAKEYCDAGSPVRREAEMHKRLTVAYFEELARREGYVSPTAVAKEINLLHEGATAIAQINGEATSALEAKSIASRLIRSYEKA